MATTRASTSTSPVTSQAPVAPTRGAASATYVFPVQSRNVGYAHTHHDYPATDIIAKCGLPVVAPTDATVTEVRRVDSWDPKHDNPALRGGESVTMIGTDGVRYYGSHVQNIRVDLKPGMAVKAGEGIAQVGQTGDARLSTCHLHFGISPPCRGTEWKVRRGVLYPWPYLDAWKAGRSLSPASAIATWASAHPKACADALAEPTAKDAG
ncbi:MAG: putative metalloprotease [Acidimicrobiia bacterium]|nr:putative metalloprotease [Acidimicrobiia bacterium]